MKKTVDIFAPLRNYTGYAEVVRNLVWRLYLYGWKINFKEFDQWAGYKIDIGQEMESFFSLIEKNNYPTNLKLHICLPEQCNLEENKKNINLTMFEASRCLPDLWVAASHRLDYIVVPTSHNYRLWNENLLHPNKKIFKVPFGIDLDKVHTATVFDVIDMESGVDIRKEFKYQLLVLQEFISRKNLEGAIEAFYLGCVKNPERCKDTCLVIKINSNSGNKLPQFHQLHAKIKSKIEQQYKMELAHNVLVYSRWLDESQVYNLFNCFTHYYSMSFGEGWDLNCIKAAALGKQLIVPASTSYLEYLDETTANLVPCIEDKFMIQEPNLVRIYKNSLWTLPSIDIASDYIANLDKLPMKNASQNVLDNYTWDDSAQRLSDTLETIERDGEGKLVFDMAYPVEQRPMMVCKTIGTPCGIGEYAKTLHKSFNEVNKPLITVGGDCYDTMIKLEKYHPNVAHFQHEYQFYTLDRMKMMVRRMREKKISLMLTQHTYNDFVYEINKFIIDNFDVIVVHNPKIKKKYMDIADEQVVEDKVFYAPMPVERIYDPNKNNYPLQVGKLNIAFFGFCYFHKGLDRLISVFRGVLGSLKPEDRERICLNIFSRKPVQDFMNYYEQCVALINAFGMQPYIKWNNSYLEISDLVNQLHNMDFVFLPYDDYGSIGASAALATCIQAEHPVIYCSEDSPYFDMDGSYKPNLHRIWNNQLEETLSGIVNAYLEGHVAKSDNEVWNRMFCHLSWSKFVTMVDELHDYCTESRS